MVRAHLHLDFWMQIFLLNKIMIMGPLAFAFDISLGVARLNMPNYICHISLHFLKGISKFKVSLENASKVDMPQNFWHGFSLK